MDYFNKYYWDIIKNKYAQFTGRAARKEYWMYVLFNIIIAIILGILDSILFRGYGVLGLLYTLATIIPGIALGIRRLHDIGYSGWWLLIGLIPFIGWIIVFIFTLIDSQPGDNQYGPNPKGVASTSTSTTTPPPPTPPVSNGPTM